MPGISVVSDRVPMRPMLSLLYLRVFNYGTLVAKPLIED